MTSKNFTPAKGPTLTTGSSHYRRGLGIQPIEFIESNKIPYHEANVIKYVFRWRNKDGLADLHKAIWYIQRLIELEGDTQPKRIAAMPGKKGQYFPPQSSGGQE